MPRTDILLPMVALAIATFLVALQIPIRRFTAVARRQVGRDDFAGGESARVPLWVRLPNRNLVNLLEMPTLFYVVCLTWFVTGLADPTARTLAWAYVGLRVAHSLVHVTYNHVIHRLLIYASSNVVLVVLWVRLGLALA